MMDRRLALNDPGLGGLGLALVALDDVDALDGDPSGLGEHPEHLPPFALFIAGNHLHAVTLGDVQPHPHRCLPAYPLGLFVHERLHATTPPAPARRSSYSASRGARGPPARK